jgi:type II secretory ATPase GspE/PulE/Tfp pilus assembly ATPase PilB-like protein
MNISPFESNFMDLIKIAGEVGASDLHIEPFEEHVTVRMRVDGTLRTVQTITQKKLGDRLVQQAKRLSGFDMGKFGLPQDSRFKAPASPFDLRANLIPTLYGEKMVLRLLERDKKFSLEHYPLDPKAKDDLRQCLARWQGLILVTGPTGSGKTTLLYSALSEIDQATNNIHTLEDPVEYTVAGVTQTPMGKLSFAEALSALMRQDPDVILVGEIRDNKTAEAALHAASTGHLVLSTIHANSALESIQRLVGLGVAEDLVRSNLLFASAQRLVPKNCPACLKPDPAGQRLLQSAFETSLIPMTSMGCSVCEHTGIKGRTLLFEYVLKQKDHSLRSMSTLKDSALSALKKGEINAANALSAP